MNHQRALTTRNHPAWRPLAILVALMTAFAFNIPAADAASGTIVVDNASGAATTEAATTVTFDVRLSVQPEVGETVVVAVASSDTGEATVSSASLSFDDTTWNTAQQVTVTGVDDVTVDGDVSVTITASQFSASAGSTYTDGTLNLTNTDDDVAGFTVTESGGTTVTDESGTTDTFTVVLDAQPVTDVVFTVTSSDTGEATVDQATLTFTNSNWNTAQTVTVTGIDEVTVDGTQPVTVTISVDDAASNDAFDPLADQTVTASNTDDDVAGFTVTESGGTTVTDESGTTDTFTVVLDAQPVTDVVFTVTSSDTGEATVDQATLTFTNSNWNTAQTVTVTGIDEVTVDGTQPVTVTISVDDAASNDAFDPLADQTVTASNTDDDVAGFTVTESGGTTVTDESGTTDTFTVVLDAQPVTDVVFTVTSSDTGEATVDQATLTFTNGNWNTAQTVTVTGIDDAVNDNTQPVTVTISVDDAASNDAFDPLADQTVTATNTDDDEGAGTAGTSFEDLSGLSDEAVTSIELLVELGVTSGTSATQFSPSAIVSRWEMALFIARTLDATAFGPVDGAATSFEDLGGFSSEVQDAIDTLSASGITNGITGTEFDPYGSVTRWQMAIFLTRLLDGSGVALPDATGEVPFTDLDGYSTEAREAIEQLYRTGISTGTSASTFSPGEALPRWQMAIFLARAIDEING